MRINQGSKTRDFPEGTWLTVKKCLCQCHTSGMMHVQACCDNGYYVDEIKGGIQIVDIPEETHFVKDWNTDIKKKDE